MIDYITELKRIMSQLSDPAILEQLQELVDQMELDLASPG